jgi:hypothetical protein
VTFTKDATPPVRGFWSLSISTNIRVEFFGKSIYVEQRIKPRTKRKSKVTLKSSMS